MSAVTHANSVVLLKLVDGVLFLKYWKWIIFHMLGVENSLFIWKRLQNVYSGMKDEKRMN